jgi:hypothetical protein
MKESAFPFLPFLLLSYPSYYCGDPVEVLLAQIVL